MKVQLTLGPAKIGKLHELLAEKENLASNSDPCRGEYPIIRLMSCNSSNNEKGNNCLPNHYTAELEVGEDRKGLMGLAHLLQGLGKDID